MDTQLSFTPTQILSQPGMKELVAERVLMAQRIFEKIPCQHVAYLNDKLLLQAVESCYCDMFRLKVFRGIIAEDSHKQAAFFIIWIAKLRPVQLRQQHEMPLSQAELEVNAWFALFIGLTLLGIDTNMLNRNPRLSNYIRNLAYLLHWHHFDSPERMASELFLLEQVAIRSST